MKYRLSILSLIMLAAPVTAIAAESRTVTIDDLGNLSYVGDPVVSGDGRFVAYTYEGQIYVVPSAGGEPRPITSNTSRAYDPHWSKDDKALYFISNRSGTRQVWKLPLQTYGEAVAVTKSDRPVTSLDLSPEEARVLVNWDDEAGKKEAKGERKEPWVINRLQFKEDAGEGYLTAPPSDHLYWIDLDSGDTRQVTAGRYAESDAAWAPNGDELVFVSNRDDEPDEGYRNDLWIVSSTPAENPADMKLRRLTTGDDVKDSPVFSPDGRQVAYLSAEDGVYGISRLAIIPATGGEPQYLTADLDRWVADFAFSADGRWIWFTYEDHGARHLARVRLRDGQVEPMLEGNVSVSGFDVDASGNAFVRLSHENDSADLYRLKNGKLARLTETNGDFFREVRLGQKEKISYTSTDDTEVEAFVTKPPDFQPGRRYPTILDIHGGPVGQFSWGYDFGAQFFAANGYVVVQPNPRGSTGRGQDFIRAIYGTWGITEYPDVVGAVDRAIELGYADPDALAVTGYSYGGYMTNTVITRTTRFKAAATGAGHSFIAANFGHDIYQKWYSWELGVPWANRDKYDRLSPLLKAENVKTPTIFLGGRDDWNVPILNAELFYQALRKRGVETQLVVYPGMHHGGWDERFDKDYLERVVAWFDRHTKAN